MREHKDYRNTIEQLNEQFPDREFLSVKDVVRVTGLCDKTVRKRFQFNDRVINKASLARQMCEGM